MEKKLPRFELLFDEESMEGVYGVSLVSDPAIQIQAVKFSKEQIELSKEQIDVLLSKGEQIDTKEWLLIDEKVVEDESVYALDLSAITPTEGDSIQDNEIFKIRYSYAPKSTSKNSRDFCVSMINANAVYRKEDLVSSNANKGFGAGGSDTYNIFLYKGGVNCKHYWQRNIYLKRNNKEMTLFEALQYIGKLDKENQKKVKFEQNPDEVRQVASADNNYWKLSTELRDIKMSSEEKRILTSPVLLPEQDIYRNFDGQECNVYFSAETIERLQQNFFKNHYQTNSTFEHKELLEGVYFFESWIVKDPKNDKANSLGFNVPVGTWMMSMKVENQQIWDEYVKTGKITGFSIDSRLGVDTKKKI